MSLFRVQWIKFRVPRPPASDRGTLFGGEEKMFRFLRQSIAANGQKSMRHVASIAVGVIAYPDSSDLAHDNGPANLYHSKC